MPRALPPSPTDECSFASSGSHQLLTSPDSYIGVISTEPHSNQNNPQRPRGTAAQSNFHTFFHAANRLKQTQLEIASILHNLQMVSQVRFGTQVAEGKVSVSLGSFGSLS